MIVPKHDIVIYHGSGEWSALYVRGKLESVGDTYLIWEALTRVLEIEEVESDAFMLGGDYYSDVAATLDEVRKYEEAVDEQASRAAELIERAAKYEEEAAELRRIAKDMTNAV